MSMELFASHDQFVADLPSDDEEHHLGTVLLDIIQDAEVTDTQFVLRQRVRAKTPDRFRWDRRLVSQPSRDRRLDDALLANRQGSELRVSFVGNRNSKRHPETERLGGQLGSATRSRLPVREDTDNWPRQVTGRGR
jgi:hypothetical protein